MNWNKEQKKAIEKGMKFHKQKESEIKGWMRKANEVFKMYRLEFGIKKKEMKLKDFRRIQDKCLWLAKEMIEMHKKRLKEWNKERVKYWEGVISELFEMEFKAPETK